MRIHNRILCVTLLSAPALVACDKQENHDTEAETEAATDTDAASATESTSATETASATESATETASATESASATETASATESASATEDTNTTSPAPEVICDDAHYGAARACPTGTQYCTWSGEFGWGACIAEPACTPGEELDDNCTSCDLSPEGVPFWDGSACGGGGDEDSTTPLVLSFDGAQVRYASAGHRFDLGPQCAATDWPTATTPWLALDRDRSGGIEGGHELFGSATRLRAGGVADNGFTALKDLDSDGDGRLTAADPGFAELVVWSDNDGDRRSTGLELQPVASLGLVAIELGYASDRRCDVRGNCEVERASFTYTDMLGRTRTGEVVDVHLGCQ